MKATKFLLILLIGMISLTSIQASTPDLGKSSKNRTEFLSVDKVAQDLDVLNITFTELQKTETKNFNFLAETVRGDVWQINESYNIKISEGNQIKESIAVLPDTRTKPHNSFKNYHKNKYNITQNSSSYYRKARDGFNC